MTLRAGLVVLGDVGVEQQQRHPADLGAPDVGVQLAAAGQRERDRRGRAVGLAQQRQRQAVGVEHRVVLLLPAVADQALAEVAGLVEQADADDRHAEVGGRLEVVAREDAEAAGVLRQRGGDAELRREVGDRRGHALGLLAAPALVPAGLAEVAVEVLLGGVDPLDEGRVGGEPLELVGLDAPRAWRPGPRRRRPSGPGRCDSKRSRGGGCQRPPQVHREVAERGDAGGQDGADAEPADGLHEGSS